MIAKISHGGGESERVISGIEKFEVTRSDSTISIALKGETITLSNSDVMWVMNDDGQTIETYRVRKKDHEQT